jgi:hypothetical protein
VSGTTTLTAPAIVPVNFNTWFLPFDTAPFVKVNVAPVVIATASYPAIACSKIVKFVFVICPQVPEFSPCRLDCKF